MGCYFVDGLDPNNPPPGTLPFSHARILWDNSILRTFVSALPFTISPLTTAATPGHPAIAALTPLTYEAYQSAHVSDWVWGVDYQDIRPANCIAIAAHTFGGSPLEEVSGRINIYLRSAGARVAGLPFATIDIAPGDFSPIMIFFPTRGIQGFDIESLRPGGYMGYVSAGVTMDMPRPIYAGHRPSVLSRKNVVNTPRSIGGQSLGFQVRSQGSGASFDWKNIEPDWYREHFDPFVQFATQGRRVQWAQVSPSTRSYRPVDGGCFFIAWRPGRFPDDAAFGNVTDDISPTNNGAANMMDVSFTLDALGPGTTV